MYVLFLKSHSEMAKKKTPRENDPRFIPQQRKYLYSIIKQKTERGGGGAAVGAAANTHSAAPNTFSTPNQAARFT